MKKLFVSLLLLAHVAIADGYLCGAPAAFTSCGFSSFSPSTTGTDYASLVSERLDIDNLNGGSLTGTGAFHCPNMVNSEGNVVESDRQFYSVEISQINLATGEYTCNYINRASGQRILTCDYKNIACARDVDAVKYGFNAAPYTEADGTVVGPTFAWPNKQLGESQGFIGFAAGEIYKNDPDYDGVQGLNYHDLQTHVKNALGSIDDHSVNVYRIAQYYGINDTEDTISGSGEPYRYTIAAAITGLVTLDDRYFSGVDIDGEIQFAQQLGSRSLSAAAQAKVQAVAETVGLKDYWNDLTGAATEYDTADTIRAVSEAQGKLNTDYITEEPSMLDLFDKKLWGYWITLMSNMQMAYSYINTYMFLLAGIFMVGVLVAQKGIRSIARTQDSTEYGMKFVGAMIGLVLFFAPIPPNSAITLGNVEGTASGENSPLSSFEADFNPSSTDGAFTSNYAYQTTVVKEFIQFFAQLGNDFATILANASQVSYLDYLVKRQEIAGGAEYGTAMKQSYIKGMVAQKEYLFFKNVCIPMYESGYAEKRTFRLTDHYLADYMPRRFNVGAWNGSAYDSWSDFVVDSGVNSVSPFVCRTLESSYKGDADAAVRGFDKIYNMAEGVDKDVIAATEMIIHNSMAMQSYLGWINIATLPTSMFFLKEAGVFQDGQKSGGVKTRVEMASDLTDSVTMSYRENENLSTTLESSVDAVNQSGAWLLSQPLNLSVYFMAPMFADLQKYVKDILFNAFGLGTETKKDKGGLMKKAVAKIISVIPLGKFAGFATSALEGIGASVLYIIATVIAAWLYMFVLQIIFLSIIAMMIIFKIVLYFVDLLKYFFVSPFVVMWSVAVQGGYQKISAFIGQGVVLTLYPALIVLSATIFVFAYELMQALAGMLLGSTVSQLETQYEALNSTGETNWVSAWLDYLKLYTMEAAVELTVLLVSLFLAYKILYEGPAWFLKLFGYKEGETQGGQMMREVSEKTNKIANPVV